MRDVPAGRFAFDEIGFHRIDGGVEGREAFEVRQPKLVDSLEGFDGEALAGDGQFRQFVEVGQVLHGEIGELRALNMEDSQGRAFFEGREPFIRHLGIDEIQGLEVRQALDGGEILIG